ncbi:MAG: dipeptidase, partial [Firmicutes bacterium]|nr:dipeptidase [Candidatus Colimorpha enterica]
TLDVSTENFYWSSRLIGALADAHYGHCIQHVERYQLKVPSCARAVINEYDAKMIESGDFTLMAEANKKIAEIAKRETTRTLNAVLASASEQMKNGYSRSDN